MDASELNNITDEFDKSKKIYHASTYKYGIFKSVLIKLYPNHSDYKIKTVFDYLIKLDIVQQVPHQKSYRYRYNKKKFIESDPSFIVRDDGKFVLRFE
jgi:hypothetical protein